MTTIIEKFEDTKKRIESYPNWKMMYRVLNMIKAKKLTQIKRAQVQLGIIMFELIDIISILDEHKLIDVFYTTNMAHEKYSHFKLSKFGKFFMRWNGAMGIKKKKKLPAHKEFPALNILPEPHGKGD